MKIYALYYKDTFVVAFPNREDCVAYGQKHYEGSEWDCNIIEKFIHDYPKFIDTKPSTPYVSQHIPCEQNIPDIWAKGEFTGGFTVDYMQTPKTNEPN